MDVTDLSPLLADALRRLMASGFAALWDGRSPLPAELVAAEMAAEVIAHLDRQGRIELSEDGRVIGVHGLSLRPTAHWIEYRGRSVHTWCALDVIGIPAALGIDATAVTGCPSCHRQLRVTVSDGEPAVAPEAVLWQPDWAAPHLRRDFCSAANLFCSVEHLHEWVEGRQGAGTVMTVPEVGALGREIWSDVASIGL